MASALALDHIAFERLDSLLISFDNLIVHSDIITRLEFGKILLAGQLLMYICYGVHNCNFRTAKVGAWG